MNTLHSKSAQKFLNNQDFATWFDNTLWTIREKRDAAAKSVPEWEELREAAYNLKMYSNSHLEDLLQLFEINARSNGVQVFWAKDADDYCRIVYNILKQHNVKCLLKSKSMLADECDLTHHLESTGIEVVENDIGERILQKMNEQPSHMLLTSMHIKREDVARLYARELGTEVGSFDPSTLIHEGRMALREKYLQAKAVLTGVNFAVADTGEVVVCTNEGNADMGTSQARLQISSFGIEKIVPDLESLGVFMRLLGRSAVGQPIPAFTTHYRKPAAGGEMYFIITDNGRSKILADKKHVKTLNCIRCGACLNTCPVYRRSGGASYSYFIPGPIGITLGMLKAPLHYYGNVSACSLCYSCNNVCPVKVDLAQQIYSWRQEVAKLGKTDQYKKVVTYTMSYILKRPTLLNKAIKWGYRLNSFPEILIYNPLNKWGRKRDFPKFAKMSFNKMWDNDMVKL